MCTAMTGLDPRHPKPVHTRPAFLAVVWLGGSLGTASRFLLSRALPAPAQLPLGTFLINLVGALALGALLGRLAASGPERGRRRLARLAAGTGFVGGFTTYSALAVDTVTLTAGGRPGWAAAYALATVVLGVGAAALGHAVTCRRSVG